jgi:glycosyltransferase involved in cell wall biosynthesis
MQSNPRVSVVIIFLNEERFLQDAIESVFAQGYKDWELLLVDDGSTDASTALALRYAEQAPARVRYLEHAGHQNRGMSASRNLGIRHAHGKYIAILDADDVWFPHALEDQVAILESHPQAALVYGRVQRWYSWSGKVDDLQRDSIRELGVAADTLVRPPTQLILLLRDQGMPSGVLARREVVQRVGGFEEAFRGLYEDNAFLAKICLGQSVFASSKCWYRYRKHSAASCAVAVDTGQYLSARLTFLSWVEQYLTREGVEDAAIWRALRQELRPYRHPLWHQVLARTRQLARRTSGLLKRSSKEGRPSPSSASAPSTSNQEKFLR